MSLKDKLNQVTRRDFLKGVSAVGATAAVYGCGGSGDGGKTYMEEDEENRLTPPAITETVVAGAAPHNCGGRCVTKAYVKDGVIKRFVTDETPDLNIVNGESEDLPQMRACIRCRSNTQRFYRNDRVLYPLKQTGERGDVNGFVRISWEEVATEIAAKLTSLKALYGAKSFSAHYASGDGSEVAGAASCASRLLNIMGGQMTYRNDYSWPSLEHTSWFFFGQNFYFPPGKSRQDAFNSDALFIWSGNFAESIWGTNTAWYIQQIKEKGTKVFVIDGRVSQTVVSHASEHIAVVPGTDAALVQAIMHELIVNTWNTDGSLKADPWLDAEFILRYTHGFFDDEAFTLYPAIAKTYHADVDRSTDYIVPDGSSLSAYIMGTDDRLVQAGLNGDVSVYPSQIGYNNYNADDPNDNLKDALVSVYGKVAKTPEWAESICGIPAAKIRELAEIFAKKKVTLWFGGGFQRQSEGEQLPLNGYTLGVITKNFGEPGRHVGVYTDRQPLSFGVTFPTGTNNAYADFTGIYDLSKLTAPDYTPAVTRSSYPVFLWPDIAKYGGTGKSMWNDGQVKNFPTPMKAILNFGGNCLVNQCGDYNTVSGIIKDRNNVELIVTADQFMTASAKFSDYVLPAATAFEKEGACSGWLAGDALICMNKAVEPLGEALPDYDIVAKIADKLGVLSEYTEGKTVDDWRKEAIEPLLTAYNAGMTYDEWKEKGLFHMDSSYGITDPLAAYRTDPHVGALYTPTGKFEIYSQAMVEDYEARFYDNDDARVTLEGPLHDGKTTGKFVYAIPMVIPMLEGSFADGSAADPQGYKTNYPYCLNGWHIYYRSHSTHSNNAYINEVFKKDADGNSAYLDPERELGEVWDNNVYEPIWINPADAVAEGILTGDRVIVESPRGSIYATAVVTQRVRAGWPAMGQGGWANGDNADGKPDIGGAINVLTKLRPSRICQGMTLGADTRINIRKG
ncbi:twin-arginine translocation signal domain-containing protein [Geovibrio thiophilus]|uniref:Twin-arginine translocation signal domain-containing protein n=1 Tax=Geovibrio thiophilus TaxID=139438 RepID=A0A3R5UZ46_9BACT|nr:molybdopterin-dependent oxidoreductase [Geovibrio thiophilus]QAR34003.1 twin-arginine translocation signal domain-containing protein [Geovibrio thiophilus]